MQGARRSPPSPASRASRVGRPRLTRGVDTCRAPSPRLHEPRPSARPWVWRTHDATCPLWLPRAQTSSELPPLASDPRQAATFHCLHSGAFPRASLGVADRAAFPPAPFGSRRAFAPSTPPALRAVLSGSVWLCAFPEVCQRSRWASAAPPSPGPPRVPPPTPHPLPSSLWAAASHSPSPDLVISSSHCGTQFCASCVREGQTSRFHGNAVWEPENQWMLFPR